ncbi:hypothetical protein [Sphingomonas oleivorans]|uniref:hypothetical protein n=1 Tax=Sphingomonas oleivorans TaxID=1735121 RepID=UPI0010572625|nr:hypothetical protein [Sphingomonas oleivorans]
MITQAISCPRGESISLITDDLERILVRISIERSQIPRVERRDGAPPKHWNILMRQFRFDALRADGSIRELSNFLEPLSGADFVWSILDFDGVGIAPNNMRMDEFTAMARSQPNGILLRWQELVSFSAHIHQTYDCLIVGAEKESDIDRTKIVAGDYAAVTVVIEAVDMSYWNVWAPNDYQVH